MKFKVPIFDSRRFDAKLHKDIIDADTGKVVGWIVRNWGIAGTTISLFGGKYSGQFSSSEECAAYAEGVEDAINQMTRIPPRQTGSDAA